MRVLEEFIEKAQKSDAQAKLEIEVKGIDLTPAQIWIDRNAVEIVARRLIVQDGGNLEKKSALRKGIANLS